MGKEEDQSGMADLISNGAECSKQMNTGSPETTYVDITNHIDDTVTTKEDGWGEFRCIGASVSVWVPK